jgi:hypothetical protein
VIAVTDVIEVVGIIVAAVTAVTAVADKLAPPFRRTPVARISVHRGSPFSIDH